MSAADATRYRDGNVDCARTVCGGVPEAKDVDRDWENPRAAEPAEVSVPELEPSLAAADKAAIESDDFAPATGTGNLNPEDDEPAETPVGRAVISPKLALLLFRKSSRFLLAFLERASSWGTKAELT